MVIFPYMEYPVYESYADSIVVYHGNQHDNKQYLVGSIPTSLKTSESQLRICFSIYGKLQYMVSDGSGSDHAN